MLASPARSGSCAEQPELGRLGVFLMKAEVQVIGSSEEARSDPPISTGKRFHALSAGSRAVYGLNSKHHMSESSAARKRDDESLGPALPRSRRPALVLIADDTRDARELYGLYLRHVGFSVELAVDGLTAVDAAIRLQPDVIVMDLSMPGLDGIAATQHLKNHRRTRHIPVILLTGYPHEAIDRRALERGIDVFLTKPCLPEDLESQVRLLLDRGSG